MKFKRIAALTLTVLLVVGICGCASKLNLSGMNSKSQQARQTARKSMANNWSFMPPPPSQTKTSGSGETIITHTTQAGSGESVFMQAEAANGSGSAAAKSGSAAPSDAGSSDAAPADGGDSSGETQSGGASAQGSRSNADEIVYVMPTGRHYHRASCKMLIRGGIPMRLDEAEARGYEPCGVCNP